MCCSQLTTNIIAVYLPWLLPSLVFCLCSLLILGRDRQCRVLPDPVISEHIWNGDIRQRVYVVTSLTEWPQYLSHCCETRKVLMGIVCQTALHRCPEESKRSTVAFVLHCIWLHYNLQVLQLLCPPPCSWHSFTLLQSAFTVSSPTPHHSHFAVQMQVHMIARTLAILWKR